MGKKEKKPSNVIHVLFGDQGDAVVQEAPPAPTPPKERHDEGDPLAGLYTTTDVARLFNLTASRLRYWAKTEFIVPSATRGKRKFYTFQDLIGVRAARDLLSGGVPLQEVRLAVASIKHALPRVVRPLTELKVVTEGSSIIVRDSGGDFDAKSGQRLLDFNVSTLHEDVVRVLRKEVSETERQSAYTAYLEGCRGDEDEQTFPEAEAAYRKAIRLDPSLSNAYTNLGNLLYRQGRTHEAITLYNNALRIDEEQPEAHYNLGFLAFEDDDVDGALHHFEIAVRIDPGFSDAHFNLALTYERLGKVSLARVHWKLYLEIEPNGEWASIARRHLK